MNFKKIIAYIGYNCFAAYLPGTDTPVLGRISKRIRGLFFTLYTGSTGKNINIQRKVTFSSKVSLGDNSGIGMYSTLQGPTYIGENVMIGEQLLVYTTNHNTKNTKIPMIEQGMDVPKPVIIKDDVWIGARVTILPGVTIGEGAIIGAGSIVTKDVPPFSLAAGNPAVIKKMR